MASEPLSSPNSNLTWTAKKNREFENALAIYDKESPERWHKIAMFIGGTSEEEVKRQYEILLEDIKNIESGKVPLPSYKPNGGSSRGDINNKEQRLKNLKLQ